MRRGRMLAMALLGALLVVTAETPTRTRLAASSDHGDGEPRVKTQGWNRVLMIWLVLVCRPLMVPIMDVGSDLPVQR